MLFILLGLIVFLFALGLSRLKTGKHDRRAKITGQILLVCGFALSMILLLGMVALWLD